MAGSGRRLLQVVAWSRLDERRLDLFVEQRLEGFPTERLLEILAGDLEGRDPQQIFDGLAKGVSTPELKIEMQEGEHYRFIERFRERASFEGARVTTIDGVRADRPDGWGLVRASNTTPVLVLRFDADTEPALRRIQDVFRRQLLLRNHWESKQRRRKKNC